MWKKCKYCGHNNMVKMNTVDPICNSCWRSLKEDKVVQAANGRLDEWLKNNTPCAVAVTKDINKKGE